MKLFFVVLLAVCAVAMAAPADRNFEVYNVNEAPALFEKFVKDYEREYKDEADKKAHYDAFVKSLETINKLNAESTSATYGINKFADQTDEERKQMRGLVVKKN